MVRLLAAVGATFPRFPLSIAIALLALASATAPAAATVVQRLDFDDQCVAADRIFVGTVRAIDVRRNPRAQRFFETIVTFGVEETVAGAVPAQVHVRLSGGTIGDERQSIDGMPDFAIGERYVVMLDADRSPPLVSPIVGFNQGLYRVVAEPGSERPLVRDRRGRPLEALPPAGARVPQAAATTEPALEGFVSMIRAARGR